MIDTHSHLNFKAFNKDRQEVIERCFDYGVTKIINVGSQGGTSRKAIEISDNKKLFASVGIHPTHWDLAQEEEMSEIAKLAKKPVVKAIGETGLDYYREKADKVRQAQIKLFNQQIDLAKELNLALILHCREAFEDFYGICQDRVGDIIAGVAHCFTGNKLWAKKFLDLGFFIGFTGIITFKNSNLTEVVNYVPLERILLETDCPYLAPEPYRGQRSEPWQIKFIVQTIAKLKQISYNNVVKTTSDNAYFLFFNKEAEK